MQGSEIRFKAIVQDRMRGRQGGRTSKMASCSCMSVGGCVSRAGRKGTRDVLGLFCPILHQRDLSTSRLLRPCLCFRHAPSLAGG